MTYSLVKVKTADTSVTGQPPSDADLVARELAFDGDKTLYIKRPSDGAIVKVSGGIPDGGQPGQMLTPNGWVDPPSDDWADITNKPSTFPPSSHAHTAADIGTHSHTAADLPATMPPSTHGHSWSQVANTPTTLSGYGITDSASLTTTAASPLNTTAAAGTATTAARADHVHAYPTAAQVGASATGHSHTQGDVTGLFDSTAPAALSTTAASGSSTVAARRDHVHARPSLTDLGAAATVHTHVPADVTGIDKLPLKVGTASLSGSTLTLDRDTGTIFTYTATANLTVALANPATGGETLYVLRLTNGGAYTITWPTGATWVGGAEPALAANGVDEIHMLRSANGSSVRMVALLANYPDAASTVIPDTGVTPGTYSVAEVTINAEGRITNASNGTSGVTPGNYTAPTITVDAYGRITNATSGSALNDTGVTAATYTNAALTVDAKGRITSAVDGPTISAGDYTNTNLTVDAKGRITSIANGTGGGGGGVSSTQEVGTGWVLVEEKNITSATTSVTFSNLNGDSDVEYEISGMLVGGSATIAHLMLRPNGDATATNFKAEYLQGNSASVTSAALTNWAGCWLTGASNAQYGSFKTRFMAKSGSVRTYQGETMYQAATSSVTLAAMVNGLWANTTSNITSLTLASDNSTGTTVTNGIGVGSRIALYARRKLTAAVGVVETKGLKYGYFTLGASNQTTGLAIGSPVLFNTVTDGNLSVSNGTITLPAGGTYEISFNALTLFSNNTGWANFQWYNVTTGAYIGATTQVLPTTSAGNTAGQNVATAIVVAATETQVQLRIQNIANLSTIYSSYTYALVKEIGKAVTVVAGSTISNTPSTWVMVDEQNLTSPATNITFSGLDGNSDVEYELRGVIVSNAANAYGMLRFNGDATAANYKVQNIQASASSSASLITTWAGVVVGGGSAVGRFGTFKASVNSKAGSVRSGFVNSSQDSTSSSMNYQNIGTFEWTNTTDNITSITIAADSSGGASVANGFAAGTHVALYARRKIGVAAPVQAGFRGAYVLKNTQQSIPNGAWTTLTWQQVEYDSDSFWSSGNSSRITIPAGINKVRISAQVMLASSVSQTQVIIYKNGSALNGPYMYSPGAGFLTQITSPIMNVAAGDYFEISYLQGSGAAVSTHANVGYNYVSMEVVDPVAVAPAGLADYSTNETATGQRWIDGKMIYRKVIDFGALPNAAGKAVNHNIIGLTRVISVTGTAFHSTGGDPQTYPLPRVNPTSTYSMDLYASATTVTIATAYNYSTYNAYIILEYTK